MEKSTRIPNISRGPRSLSSYLEDTATDGHVTREWALLVHVGPLLGRLGSLEPKTNVLHETHTLL